MPNATNGSANTGERQIVIDPCEGLVEGYRREVVAEVSARKRVRKSIGNANANLRLNRYKLCTSGG